MTHNKVELFDLSLLKNQNTIACMFASIVGIDDLNSLYNLVPIAITNIDIDTSDPQKIILEELFDNKNKKIQVIDNVDMSIFPTYRYLQIIISNKSGFETVINCKMDKRNSHFISLIIGNTINFKNYKNHNDLILNRMNIINNFALEMSKDISIEDLEEVKMIVGFSNADNKILNSEENVSSFKIGKINYFIETLKYGIIRFKYTSGRKNKYIYLDKTKIGFSTLSLIVEKAIYLKLNNSSSR